MLLYRWVILLCKGAKVTRSIGQLFFDQNDIRVMCLLHNLQVVDNFFP